MPIEPINVKQFFRACNPSVTLNYGNQEDKKYYIDFSSVRSGSLIRELKRKITHSSNEQTCQLFTGHIGCGKSTELLRLKAELEEEEKYYVVYFESSEFLDMGDLDITDILLVIAHRITENLGEIGLTFKPSYFQGLFAEIKKFLTSEIEFDGVQFSLGLAKITAKTKDSPRVRTRLRNYLEPLTNSILNSINAELLQPAIQQLKKDKGKKGLVVIVDNLDRIDNTQKTPKRSQPEYIFIDRGEQLKKLQCHLVYTIPLTLMFSNEAASLMNRFGVRPRILPMVPVRSRDGELYKKGLDLLKQMVMVRAFPDVDKAELLKHVGLIFEEPSILDSLCRLSGGHVRSLLVLLNDCLQKQDPPFSRETFDEVIQEHRDDLLRKLEPNELALMKQVTEQRRIGGQRECEILLQSMFAFEYRDAKGRWLGINPLLENLFKSTEHEK